MKWLNFGVKLIPMVMASVHAVENIAKAKKGKDKQDAAMEAVGVMITSLEYTFSRELMNEKSFQSLLRKLIDDYVAIQNFVTEFRTTNSKIE